MERLFEKAMYSARWLLAPIYLGLSFTLLALGIKFFTELYHTLPQILSISEMDLTVGGLIVMVMFSGYENFVSRLDLDEGDDKLSWLGKLDTASLKNKVAASIVAISSIHLLKVFMNAEKIDNEKMLWYVVLHITFVLSAFMMGVLDKMTRGDH